jgi:hypothetical protein
LLLQPHLAAVGGPRVAGQLERRLVHVQARGDAVVPVRVGLARAIDAVQRSLRDALTGIASKLGLVTFCRRGVLQLWNFIVRAVGVVREAQGMHPSRVCSRTYVCVLSIVRGVCCQ